MFTSSYELGGLPQATVERRHLCRQCSKTMTADNGKQGRQRAVALTSWPFKRGTMGAKVSFS